MNTKVFILLLLTISATAAFAHSFPKCDAQLPRRDCNKLDQASCEKASCCWNPVNNTDPNFGATALTDVPTGIPWCYYPQSWVGGYAVNGETKVSNGLSLNLNLQDGNAYFGPDLQQLKVDVTYETNDRIRVKIYDANNARFEVPKVILNTPELFGQQAAPSNMRYSFSYTQFPFGFAVTRLDDNEVIFNSTVPTGTQQFNGLVFNDQYLEISTQLPTNPNIYGLGEHIQSLRIVPDGDKITTWARDVPSPVQQNEYGSHPMYLEMRNGKAHVVFLKNANAMDVQLWNEYITYHTNGGILDFYIFVGGAPEQAVQQYHQLIGNPHMPPFWSLGFHQCRWGYNTTDATAAIVQKYRDNQIPLDTMWNDIDYMYEYEDFSLDPVRFTPSKHQQFIQNLHDNGQHYVVIVDPGIHLRDGYAPYEDGLEQNVFIRRSQGDVFIGKVWPGYTAYPSFFSPNTTSWWTNNIRDFLQLANVDGLWIDMNEASNFCNGYCTPETDSLLTKPTPSPLSTINFPPYRINNAGNGSPLNVKGLDLDAVHPFTNYIEYNVHSLYGASEGISTRIALETLKSERSLVISRSTFAGSGAHVGHWLGDNWSTWASMKYSISGVLSMQLYGIPLVGADICGFIGATTEQLCARWMQLGSFYPFSRNHNNNESPPQEPYIWPSVADASRKSLGIRYSLLPYYNTLFYLANQQGGTVMRPLFFQFPNDAQALSIDTQMLLGSALMIVPVLTENTYTVNAYFPGDATTTVWYDWYTRAMLPPVSGYKEVDAPFDRIPLFILGGTVFLTQTPALTTTAQKFNPYQINVPLDANKQASGFFFVDDGLTLQVGSNSSTANLSFNTNTLTYQLAQNQYADSSKLFVNSIVFMGVESAVKSVSINGQATAFAYDANTAVLAVANINLAMTSSFTVSFA